VDPHQRSRISRIAGGGLQAPGRIDAIDATAGSFNLEIRGSDYDDVGELTEVVRLNMQLVITNPDGVSFVIARGAANLFPGD
jgi:hypothetical protein